MKRGILDRETRDLLVEAMTELNKGAPEVVKDYPVTPCTDVTGFGLIGYPYGVVRNSEKSAIIDYEKVPHIPGVTKYARLGNIPRGTYENWRFLDDKVHWKEGLSKIEKAILFDAQISGGLLFTVSENYSEQIVNCLRESGVRSASAIGQIAREYKHKIVVR